MSSIVVTGAAGFIGSHLANRLSSLGFDLLLVDTLTNFPKTSLCHSIPTPAKLIDTAEFPERLQKGDWQPSAIFHLGACSATTEKNWSYLQTNNIEYTQQLWSWCSLSGVPFLYASSAATYGDGSHGFDDRTPPEQLQPLNLYGKSKNDFDIWALSKVASGGATPKHWAGFKFFNVYGPGEIHKGPMASVVWQGFKQVERDGLIKLFASNHPHWQDGCQDRDFVYVEDCIDHMLWHWKSQAPNGIYNSGTGSARTFLDLAKAVFGALNLPPRIEFIAMPETIASQYQNHTRADMSKIQQAGYPGQPTSLEEGVMQTIAGYRNLLKQVATA